MPLEIHKNIWNNNIFFSKSHSSEQKHLYSRNNIFIDIYSKMHFLISFMPIHRCDFHSKNKNKTSKILLATVKREIRNFFFLLYLYTWAPFTYSACNRLIMFSPYFLYRNDRTRLWVKVCFSLADFLTLCGFIHD